MKKPKTAILWGCNDLLAHSMEFFIKAEEEWEVLRMSRDTGIDCLLDQVEKIHPNVIILYAEICANDPNLVMGLIEKQSNLKVITVSLQDNRMQVYCKRSVTVQKASDLLSIIEERHFSEDPVAKEVQTDEINP